MATYAKRDAPLAREQGALVLALIAVATAAWFLTERRMAGMDAGPGTDPGAFGFYVSSWVLMMAAMMFPSIVPMVLVYRLAQRRRSELRPALIAAEKLLPWKTTANLAVAAIMAALAIAVALTPSSVPGLTIPGSAPAEKAMSVTGHSPIEVHARPGPTTSQMSIRAHTKQGKTMGHMQTGAHAKTGRRGATCQRARTPRPEDD